MSALVAVVAVSHSRSAVGSAGGQARPRGMRMLFRPAGVANGDMQPSHGLPPAMESRLALQSNDSTFTVAEPSPRLQPPPAPPRPDWCVGYTSGTAFAVALVTPALATPPATLRSGAAALPPVVGRESGRSLPIMLRDAGASVQVSFARPTLRARADGATADCTAPDSMSPASWRVPPSSKGGSCGYGAGGAAAAEARSSDVRTPAVCP